MHGNNVLILTRKIASSIRNSKCIWKLKLQLLKLLRLEKVNLKHFMISSQWLGEFQKLNNKMYFLQKIIGSLILIIETEITAENLFLNLKELLK